MNPDGSNPPARPRLGDRFARARSLYGTDTDPAANTAARRDAGAPELDAHPAEAAAVAATTRSSPLTTLLAGHVLRDGETVLLVLKPSLWFIVFQSAFFAAAVGVLLLATRASGERLTSLHHLAFLEAAVFAVVGRVMWGVLQWMGRLYVLTDQRVIRLAGVFTVELHDCPLRKVARTQITATLRERLVRVGSIEIFPKGVPHDAGHDPRTDAGDDPRDAPCAGTWQTVARPVEVREQIVAAVRKAQSGG